MCFVFPSTWIKSGKKKPSCSESSWLQRHPYNTDTRTRMINYVWQRRHFLVQGEAWEEGAQGHGNCRTPEGRCAELGRDAESWGLKPKLKQTQQGHWRGEGGGGTGPQGRSHQLHLGLWVLLDHCFVHGYQIRAFELMDYITGWCIVLEVQVSFDTVKGINWDFCNCTCCLNQTAACGKDDWHRYVDPDVPLRDIYQEAVVLNAKLKTWHQTRL